MKEIIISFIIYLIYDSYMRQRDKGIYLTKADFLQMTGGTMSVRTGDMSEYERRLQALENSPYA